MLFPGRKFPILVDPKQISVIFKSDKQKKKKKKVFTSFLYFPIFHLPFYNIFLLFNFTPFPISLPLFFLIHQQKFPSQKSLGGTLPPCPHLLRHWVKIVKGVRSYCTSNKKCFVLYLKIINNFLKNDIFIL